jgi:hypothetical protein
MITTAVIACPGVLPAEPQSANVADWVTAIAESFGALGTAGAIVFRDHRNAERARVDLVGAWAEPTYERRPPGEPRVEQAKIYVFLRNASELPVEVKHLEYTIRTRWLVPTDEVAWEPVDGTPAGPYHLYDIQLRSHEIAELIAAAVKLAFVQPAEKEAR